MVVFGKCGPKLANSMESCCKDFLELHVRQRLRGLSHWHRAVMESHQLVGAIDCPALFLFSLVEVSTMELAFFLGGRGRVGRTNMPRAALRDV